MKKQALFEMVGRTLELCEAVTELDAERAFEKNWRRTYVLVVDFVDFVIGHAASMEVGEDSIGALKDARDAMAALYSLALAEEPS